MNETSITPERQAEIEAWARDLVAQHMARRDAAIAESERRRLEARAAERAARPWRRLISRLTGGLS